METQIDVIGLIEKSDLTMAQMARELFPNNVHPIRALRRVTTGAAVLDANQISKLRLLTGCSYDEIFTAERWRGTSQGGRHRFTMGDWVADYDRDTGETFLRRAGHLVHHETLLTGSGITLNAYISYLEKTIKQIENDKN